MLAGTSVAPPQLDEFFCANEAHLRAQELAELGLSEHVGLSQLNRRVCGPVCCFRRCRSTSSRVRSHPPTTQRPFVVGSGGHYPRVVAANAVARDAGIRDEQLVSGALALAPDLALRDRDDDAESHALAQLATWMLTFTPMACLAPPNAMVAEIGTSLRLFGGLPRLVARLPPAALDAWVTTMRMGIAPTPGAALAARTRRHHASRRRARARLPQVLGPLAAHAARSA